MEVPHSLVLIWVAPQIIGQPNSIPSLKKNSKVQVYRIEIRQPSLQLAEMRNYTTQSTVTTPNPYMVYIANIYIT